MSFRKATAQVEGTDLRDYHERDTLESRLKLAERHTLFRFSAKPPRSIASPKHHRSPFHPFCPTITQLAPRFSSW